MMAVRFFAGLFTPLTACIAWLLDAAGDDTGIRARNQGMFGMCSVVGFMSGAAMGGFAGYSAFEIVNCVCGGLAAFAFVNTIMAKEPERPNADSKPSGVKEISRSPGEGGWRSKGRLEQRTAGVKDGWSEGQLEGRTAGATE